MMVLTKEIKLSLIRKRIIQSATELTMGASSSGKVTYLRDIEIAKK